MDKDKNINETEKNINVVPLEDVYEDEAIETKIPQASTNSVAEADLELKASLSDNIKIMSPGKLIAKRFFRSKLSIFGLVTLILLFLFSFVGPLISPYGEIEVVEDATREFVTTNSYEIIDDETGETYYMYERDVYNIPNKAAPSWENWLGTDTMGFDVLTRLMYGGRVSLTLSFIVIFAEMFVGVLLGGLAGYFGKWVDQIIMRIVDVLNCIPILPVLLISCSLLQSWEVLPEYRIYYLMLILTIFGWPATARLVRGQILMLREQEYMVAAEALGISTHRKIFKHLIPNVMPQLIVNATLGLGSVILYEATLSFLGLGVPTPNAAWGSMINMASPSSGTGREVLANYPHIWIPAGFMIVLAVLSFNFIGDGLRDAFDPKMKR